MAPNTRPSIEEQPPPYAEDAHPLENLKAPAVVEELPEYTSHPPLPDGGQKDWKERLRRKWYTLPIIIFVIIGAIVGGVIGNNHRRKQQADASKDPPAPLITALTAAECVAGTFVFYQVNNDEIYLHGRFWDGYWNQTSAQETPSINLHLSETNLRPYYSSNLTAVCYTSTNESADEDIIVLRLFYLASPLIFDFPLVEATITLPFTNYEEKFVPAPIPVTQQVIASITNAASLSACYSEYWGLGLYYLDSPSSTGEPNTTPATITQLYWNETDLWSPSPTPLNAKAFNSGSALTAACVSDEAEIHVLYMNEDNVLAQLRFMNETWSAPSVVANIDNKGALTGIVDMAAIAPYSDPTEIYLYYLVDHRPQQAIILIDKTTGLNHLYSDPSSPSDLPDGIQAPPLIAAVTRLDAIGDQPQQSIFYVWRSNSTSTYSPQESMVLNMTTAPPPNQQSWVQDGWPMASEGNDV